MTSFGGSSRESSRTDYRVDRLGGCCIINSYCRTWQYLSSRSFRYPFVFVFRLIADNLAGYVIKISFTAQSHIWAGISPPFGNAAEHSRPLARFGETPMVGKLAPLPLRLMLCTSQPTRFESACFYIWGSTPDPNLPLFTTGSGGCAPSCQTCHNRHMNSGWISRSPSRSVSEGPLPTIGVKETAISLPGIANHENQPVFSRA